MKKIYIITAICSLSLTASAANFTGNTVGTINGNSRTFTEATGNSLNATTFAADIATAFDNDTGGVWDFETDFNVRAGADDSITLNYGTSLTNSLNLVITAGATANGINRGGLQPGEATSGTGTMGLSTTAVARTFTPDMALLTVGIFNTDRNAAGRNPQLTVNYLLGGSASTSGANADNWFFHGLSGTVANPIVSFELSQDGFVRYDDLGFVVIPEISTFAMFISAFGLLVLFRRHR